jgi:hypothetical protein
MKISAMAKQNIEEADFALHFFAQNVARDKNVQRKIEISKFKNLPTVILRKIFAKFSAVNGLEIRKSYMEILLHKTDSSKNNYL